MSESKLFISISKIAKKLVLKKWLPVQSEDLVQQAYLSVLEQGQELNLKNLLAEVDKEANQLRNRNSAKYENEINETQFSFCRKCHESKPVAAFGITIRRKTGKKVIQSYCSECQAEVMRQYRRKKGMKKRADYIDYPPGLTKKEKKAYSHKIWRDRNKEKWRDYQKVNNIKFKEKISQKKKEWYLKKKDSLILRSLTPSISKA